MARKREAKAPKSIDRASSTPFRRLRIMISSRNNDLIPDAAGSVKLSDVRKELQNVLQAETFLGRRLLDVWINEQAGAEAGDANAWETCIHEVDKADVLIVIYNGEAGWTNDAGGIGICHHEMSYAWFRTPGKVFLVQMRFESEQARKLQNPVEVADSSPQNQSFSKFLSRIRPFTAFADDREQLKTQVKQATLNAIAKYFDLGRRGMHVGEISAGPALDWSRLTYTQRKRAMEDAGRGYFISRGAKEKATDLVWGWGGEKILVRIHGIPASFGIAEARELVGRPYLNDHLPLGAKGMAGIVGPFHIILCHKAISESQVISFMGHPDLFIVKAAAGFFVADRVSFVQALFLMNAVDSDAIHSGLQSMFEWVESQAQELGNIVSRARSRASILRSVAAQIALQSETRQ